MNNLKAKNPRIATVYMGKEAFIMGGKFCYFEDYEVGQEGVTNSRTVGEAAIDTFAYITADHAVEHLDRHKGAKSPYGERVAHGLLGASLVPGMISMTAPQIVGRSVPEAFLSGFECNYRDAIKIGDTIKIKWRVSEKTDDPFQEGFGLVKTGFQVVNQEEKAVYDGTLTTRLRKELAKGVRLQFKAGEPWQVKEFVLDPEKFYYMEDFIVNEGGVTGGRTITETDIVNFSGLTGDYDPLYLDALFAKESVFGERIAPAMMVYTVGFGLWILDGDFFKAKVAPEAATWAGHLADGASFLAPVKLGDTLHCIHKVDSVRASKSKPELGILRIAFQMLNQRDEVVQEGYILMTRGTKASEK